MSTESDFSALVAQIKSELNSVGLLISGATPGPGVSVIISSELPTGWLGITDNEGRKAFGPAAEILIMVQNYVRGVREENSLPFSDPGNFWELMRDFPCERDDIGLSQ